MATDLLAQAGFFGLQPGYGPRKSACPLCSHLRQPKHQHIKCVKVWVEPHRVGWNCIHCGDKGQLLEGGDVERGAFVPSHAPIERAPLRHAPWAHVWATVKHARQHPSTFHTWFAGLVGEAVAAHVLGEYWVGTNKEGLTVFWLIDDTGQPRQPRVTRFLTNGNTDKATWPKRRGWVPEEYRTTREVSKDVWEDTGYRPCLYGEHLLSEYPNAPVALVEAEKTALVGRAIHPEWVWIGLNGSSNYNRAVACEHLRNRLVFTLFDPDEAGRKCGKEVRYGLRNKIGHGAIQEIDTWPGANSGFNLADWAAGQQGHLNLDLVTELRHPAHAPGEMWNTFNRFVDAVFAFAGIARCPEPPTPPAFVNFPKNS